MKNKAHLMPLLVAMSALNPLLVALERPQNQGEGDAGAGWVF